MYLKIFIDTDSELKKKWKIQRDVVERGYSMDKVLKQIEGRRVDYEKYILPQKDLSDIIINFHENDGLKLKLCINKKYNIDKVVDELMGDGIPFIRETNIKFNVLTFDTYCGFKNLKPHFKVGNYYDYILYFIMNVNYN